MSPITENDGAQVARPSESRRDPEWLRERLDAWIKTHEGPRAEVTSVEIPSANGMSSETLLVSARVDGIDHELVARVAPMPDSDPVFPSYDLDGQFQLIGHVAEHTDVPVPRLWWSEPDSAALGAPFFVMSRVDGEVPPDVMPYTFGSWVSEGTADQQQRLMTESVGVLAKTHAAPLPDVGVALPDAGEDPLRAHIRRLRDFYRWASDGRTGAPLIERGFAWVEEHLPAPADPVLCWGDARIGNIVYQDFAPAAVLDWEMATIGPRELDVAWMIFIHRFFQDLTEMAQLDGMPAFLTRDDVAAEYERQTGHAPADLDFYTLYAALIHAVIMYRINCRAIHFGQAEEPADPDDMILHRATLEAMMAGTYWGALADREPPPADRAESRS
ncbi:phosphotransferase family protein [Gordonia sp. HY442]|uniref:phosphotransferase family protein n=1 Tax=Gordonia zhenghanii TaxID=2911516 RepID=UPI001F1694CF|nr:phosphotransferase family protein [Gordonia zhenghanii]MCF8601928.1 phosphotransferase family protein [Gordonia zhenghanii]